MANDRSQPNRAKSDRCAIGVTGVKFGAGDQVPR